MTNLLSSILGRFWSFFLKMSIFVASYNKYAFDKMSDLNPCESETNYSTGSWMQRMCFMIVIGVLAIIVFKAEEDVLRIAYWCIIYLHLGNGYEKTANLFLSAVSFVLVLVTSVAFILCTIYSAFNIFGPTAEIWSFFRFLE